MPSFSRFRRLANFRMTIPPLRRLFFGMMIFAFTSGLARAERPLLDWSEQTVDEPPALLSDTAWMIFLQNGPAAKIVGTKSDLTNPLPDSPLALAIPMGIESANVVLHLYPFIHQEPPKKGWVEIDLALIENGMIIIDLGTSSSGSGPAPAYDGTILYHLYFRGDKTTLVSPEAGGGGGENFEISPPLMSGEPHKIRIAWDFGGEKPAITPLLDGEPFLRKSEPVVLGVDPARTVQGIDFVRISVYSGYLGKVIASE